MNVDSSHPSFYCSNFKFPMMIPLDDILNISSGFGPNYNFVFLAFFFSIVHLYLIFVVASKLKLIPFYCNHFGWPKIWQADVSWPPWELIRFWSSSVDFPHFGGILRTQGRNGLKFGLMYSYHLLFRLNFGHGMFIFLILAPFWLSETVQIWGFRDFLQNAWEEWPKIWHADVSLPPLELITFGSWSIGFPHLGAIFT